MPMKLVRMAWLSSGCPDMPVDDDGNGFGCDWQTNSAPGGATCLIQVDASGAMNAALNKDHDRWPIVTLPDLPTYAAAHNTTSEKVRKNKIKQKDAYE